MNSAQKYCQQILSGEIPSCKWIKLAAERFQSDLKRTDIFFDDVLYHHAVEFIEELHHTIGSHAGKNFILEPWQHFIIANLFGFIRKDGFRRYSRAYVEVPRKNGKSTFSNAILLYGLLADGEEGAQVYSAATKLDQAMMVFAEGARVCRKLDWLSEAVNVYNSINNRRINYGESVYRPLEWNPGKQDGLNTHMAVIDEYHAHPNDELYNVIRNSMGARKQPLLFVITTAGFNRESACYRHRQYCTKVLENAINDDSLFSVIYTLDEDDDWKEPQNWAKANPNWGVSVNPRQLEEGLSEAMELTHKEVEFKTKLLNVWTDTANVWISDENWMKCKNDIEPSGVCFGGLDLATTGDFCALSLYWPEVSHFKTWYWLPEENAKRRNDQQGDAIRGWAREGLIDVTDGNVTDYSHIRYKIGELAEKYQIKEIAYDRWNATQIVNDLVSDGMTMYPFGQGFGSMSAPTKELERLVKSKNISHDGNPVTRWMLGNVMIKRDPADNIKIDKAKSGDKVDGLVSLVMALGTYLQEAQKEQEQDFWFVNL